MLLIDRWCLCVELGLKLSFAHLRPAGTADSSENFLLPSEVAEQAIVVLSIAIPCNVVQLWLVLLS